MKNKKIIMIVVIIFLLIIVIMLGYNVFNRVAQFSSYGNYSYYEKYNEDISEATDDLIYETAINHQNKYTGVNISGIDDAIDLIESDSINEENKCNNNLSNIEKDLYSNTGIYGINFCELDIESATEISETIKKIYNDYPIINGYVTNVTIVNDGGTNSYIAAFKPSFTFATSATESKFPFIIKIQVFLNSAYYLNKDYFNLTIDNAIATNHFPSDTTHSSLVAHEFGHVLTYVLAIKYYNSVNTLYLSQDNFKLYSSTLIEYTTNRFSKMIVDLAYSDYKNIETDIDFRKNISNYANTYNDNGEVIYNETIAEAFHDYYLHGENAKNESKSIMNILSRYINNYS